MAGIGFELRRLARQDTISSVLAAAGHGAVVAAGPWLFTILSLGAITVMTERASGMATLATFRVAIIYAFALSLVLTAPITIVATRLLADALWSRRPGEVLQILVGATLMALAVVAAGLVGLRMLFELPMALGIAFAAASLVGAAIWVALCFCGAVRDYRAVTFSFLAGIGVSLVATVAASALQLGAAGMVAGFVAGLLVIYIGLAARIAETFPIEGETRDGGIRAMIAGLVHYWPLAVGGLAAAAAVWIDKWVFWASRLGEVVTGGLVHAPLYDSAMFIASLVMIPSLAAFVVRLETEFFEHYQRYFGTIRNHGTLEQVEATRALMARETFEGLALVMLIQAAISAVLILLAPALIDLLALQYRQTAILRFGALAAVFQFAFIAATAILLFFDRRQLYMGLQMVFLALNGGLTWVSVRAGEDYYGVGYFAACLIAALLAYVAAEATFVRLNYLTFIGNNPAVAAARTWRASRRRGRRRVRGGSEVASR